ncbi:MAG: helix-turn-helix domain-containing protein [Anaerolineales bacterium]|nr:helix-turn-helix domain-containing protein [Anaerolineales bacterium]
MSGHRQYKVTDYRFGQMLLGLREKVGLTQNDVADALAVSRRTIQHWEAGTAFPDIPHLKNLIAFYLKLRGLTVGSERQEAQALWAQADQSASRRKSLFDDRWFDELLSQSAAPGPSRGRPAAPAVEPTVSRPRVDWGDAPEVSQVFGRDRELAELEQAVVAEHCRLIAVLGMGGIGKTTLVVKFAQDVSHQFEFIIWRSLRDAPELQDLLTECFQILTPTRPAKPSVPLLLGLLKQHRCLLILDNVETLHRAGNLAGIYKAGFEAYQQLFHDIAQTRHQSCLILTSREMPVDPEFLEGRTLPVRAIKLTGLTSAASQALLLDKGLFGPADAWDVFVHYYSGNPLALKIASATVRDLFGGDLPAFLREAPVTLHTLQQLLGNQFEHLSVLERDILFWLAIERDPVALPELRRNFLLDIPSHEILSGLTSLLQRAMIERQDQGAAFFLLPVLLEFVTDRLVSLLAEQLLQQNLETLAQYPLVKSQSSDQIREGQLRMLLQPVLSLLKRHFGSPALLQEHLRQLVAAARRLPREAQGYAGGNLVNLLAHLNTHLKGEDFSGLTLRHVSLQGLEAQDADFSDAEFINSRFTEPLETISAMTLSPSGTYLAANTYNGQVRCWRVADGKPIWTVATQTARAWSLTFSPDETILASSHFRGTVSLWEAATGRHLHTFAGHHEWVHTLAFHPSGRYLASGGIDAQICIWDLQERKLAQVLLGHSARVWSLAFSPDGESLASGASGEDIRIWHWQTGAVRQVLRHAAKELVTVAFHPGGRWLASCSEDSPIIQLWAVDTGEGQAALTSRSLGLTQIAFNPEGTLLVSGGSDGSVEVWRVGDDQPPHYLRMLMGHEGAIGVIACGQQDRLATLSSDGIIRLWNIESGKLLRVMEGYSRLIGANAFSGDGKVLLQGDASGRIRLWDIERRRYRASLQGHLGPIFVLAVHPTARLFATAGYDRCVRLWDLDSLNCLKTYPGQPGAIFALAFNHDGSLLASGGIFHAVMLWDSDPLSDRLQAGRLETADDVWALRFDPTGATLVSGHLHGSVILWDVRSGARKLALPHGTTPVGGLRFGTDDRTLITSNNQQLLKVWDLEQAECRHTLDVDAEGNRTTCVVIGPDGRFVASGSDEPVIHLRRLGPDRAVTETVVIPGHLNRVWGIALSPDERYLASSDEEGTTLLVDIQAGRVVEKIMLDRPYERLNLRGVKGLNAAEHAALKALGAREEAAAG